MLTLKSIVVK